MTTLNANWLTNPAFLRVTTALEEAGFEAYAVGGCVRDALTGVTAKDIDVATNARPHDLPKIFGVKPYTGQKETMRNGDVALYPTGVAHGTWTVRVGTDEVEVTSYRKDVDTDGRRATVEFADTMEVDAQRRDFTMNALYADRHGKVYDPTGEGLDDLSAGDVRFVGNAEERVQEDYLRILRLFRFHARFGRKTMGMWESAAALKYAQKIQKNVSGERIWDELKKIMALPRPSEALREMEATGVFMALFGTSLSPTLSDMMVKERRYNLTPEWSRRYFAATGRMDIPFPASTRERKLVEGTFKACNDYKIYGQSALAHKYGQQEAITAAMVRGLSFEPSAVDRGTVAEMPLNATMLLNHGFTPGPVMGKALSLAKEYWYATNLQASAQMLLTVVTEEVEE